LEPASHGNRSSNVYEKICYKNEKCTQVWTKSWFLISCFTDLKYHLIRFCCARKLINDNKQLSTWRCFTMCDILDRLINCCIISVIIMTRINLPANEEVRSYSKSMSYIGICDHWKLPTLPEPMSSLPVLVGFVLLDL
jgi:hypothetical protein